MKSKSRTGSLDIVKKPQEVAILHDCCHTVGGHSLAADNWQQLFQIRSHVGQVKTSCMSARHARPGQCEPDAWQ